jgi:hypothetical protein
VGEPDRDRAVVRRAADCGVTAGSRRRAGGACRPARRACRRRCSARRPTHCSARPAWWPRRRQRHPQTPPWRRHPAVASTSGLLTRGSRGPLGAFLPSRRGRPADVRHVLVQCDVERPRVGRALVGSTGPLSLRLRSLTVRRNGLARLSCLRRDRLGGLRRLRADGLGGRVGLGGLRRLGRSLLSGLGRLGLRGRPRLYGPHGLGRLRLRLRARLRCLRGGPGDRPGSAGARRSRPGTSAPSRPGSSSRPWPSATPCHGVRDPLPGAVGRSGVARAGGSGLCLGQGPDVVLLCRLLDACPHRSGHLHPRDRGQLPFVHLGPADRLPGPPDPSASRRAAPGRRRP